MKDLFNKIANLMVEIPATEEEGVTYAAAPPVQKTVAQLADEAHGPGLHEVRVEVPHPPHPEPAATQAGATAPSAEAAGTAPKQAAANPMPVVMPDGHVDFGPVYEAAALPATPFSAEQALAMIDELPAELPLEVRRLSVRTTLGAIGKQLGVSQETVLTDAARKVAAIHSFGENLEHKVTDYVAAMQKEISDLESKIAERRASIAGVEARLSEVQGQCRAEAGRLDHLVEFLSLDIAPSKLSPPSSEPG